MMYLCLLLTSGVVDTFTYNIGGVTGLSTAPIILMLLNFAEKILIIYAAIQLIRAANIYIRKNK